MVTLNNVIDFETLIPGKVNYYSSLRGANLGCSLPREERSRNHYSEIIVVIIGATFTNRYIVGIFTSSISINPQFHELGASASLLQG